MMALVWDKQWKSRMSCLEKFALGRFRGKSDFPEGRSPEGKSDYPRDLPWKNFKKIPKGFSTVSQTLGFKNRRRCVPQGKSEHIPIFAQESLTVLNPDFGF